MKGNHQTLVKRRLLVINVVIILTSIVGLFSILEVGRGVGFHESNIQHLGLTSQLKEKTGNLVVRSNKELDDIRDLLMEIRKEPQSCLDSRNLFLEFGLRLLNTQDIFTICETDTQVIQQALSLLPRYES